MKKHNDIQQGSDAWHQLRANYFTASEAAAVMGDHKYMTRDELLRQKATGIVPEVSDHQQRLFDKGHAAEASARFIAEKILDEALEPATVTNGKYLASMDGLTPLGDIGFEHKLHSKSLVSQVVRGELENHYIWQLEHQAMVTGCTEILFMTSDGTEEACAYMIYEPDPSLQAQLKAGWEQFSDDLIDYVAKLEAGEIEQPKQAQSEVIMELPAVRYEMKDLSLTSDLPAFRAKAKILIEKSQQPLVTDNDFATAESLVKEFKKAEEKLALLADMVSREAPDIDAFRRDLAQTQEEIRQARLPCEKLITAEKQNRRQEIINKAQYDLNNYIQAQQAKLDGYTLPAYNADFNGALKGKRTIESLQSAANDTLANAKIDISQQADEGAANLKAFNQLAADHKFLFADLQQNLFKPADDFVAMVKSRIADHKAAEEQRLTAERERIRQEETAKAARQVEAELLAAEHSSKPAQKAVGGDDGEELPLVAEKPAAGKLSGVVNPDLVNNEINSIVKYMTDEGFPLKHVQAIASIVYAFNESEQSEKEIFAFADSIKKKYGVAA